MINESLIRQLPSSATVHLNAALRDYTTFRLGGACEMLVECASCDELSSVATILARAGVPFLVIGQGSNLLISDDGIECVILRYCAENAPDVSFNGCRVTVSGSTLLDDLAAACIEMGIGDISYCSGIPGTVGGAIAGNAGAFGKQIGDVVESVRLMAPDGSASEVMVENLGFAYRHSFLKESGGVVLEATLKLKPFDIDAMKQERECIMELRRSKHPDWKTMPCAGSVFRNIEPSSAAERRQAAGWFLEQAGAKNLQVGGAHLFEKHANIIIADPGSSAMDVYQLMEQMVGSVRDHFGFELRPEIMVLGSFKKTIQE
ncbi:MAG: UDP-N-acetylmuramate dehydrogenase [Pontiellaceae bacterium]|nr:UDP-N-acetylmuramate dehydrogenase [Pontiellaceae bacterium]MBN2785399.1 UDP-N-acetylmuramate dehydrogenase [Pontiellaceae bacterium]